LQAEINYADLHLASFKVSSFFFCAALLIPTGTFAGSLVQLFNSKFISRKRSIVSVAAADSKLLYSSFMAVTLPSGF